MNTHFIILNRAVATSDGWIHIVPKGELPNRAAGVIQVLDEVALDSILGNITAEAQRLGNKWPGIYAGREHFIYNDEQDSAALAWFKTFEKRADGIWAKDDGLTPLGRQALANAEYKFTSFVADRKDTEPLDGKRVRILKIDTIGFTNQANGKELLTPIVNRRSQDLPGASAPGANQNHNERTKSMKSIAQKLGLAPEASEDAILGEVTKLQNRITEAEAKVTPLTEQVGTLQNRVTELSATNAALEGEQAEALLDSHGVKEEKLRSRLKPVLSSLKSRADRLAALTDFGFKLVEPGTATATGRVLNRESGRPAGGAASDNGEFPKLVNRKMTELKLTKADAIAAAITENQEAYTEWLKSGAGKI
jgi:phage I-like protein